MSKTIERIKHEAPDEVQARKDFEEWLVEVEDDISIELAETGADREMDFDIEREFIKRYEMYLNAR